LSLRHFLAVQADEIHRIKQKWWKAAIADGGRDDFAREREQQPRALDEYDRVQAFLRDVAQAEYPGEFQFEAKEQGPSRFRLAFELDADLDIGIRERLGADIDLNADLRLLLARDQRLRRIGILERKILDILRYNGELRLRVLRRGLPRTAIRRCHKNSRRAAYLPAWRLANIGSPSRQGRYRSAPHDFFRKPSSFG